jgi:hypothetical protein
VNQACGDDAFEQCKLAQDGVRLAGDVGEGLADDTILVEEIVLAPQGQGDPKPANSAGPQPAMSVMWITASCASVMVALRSQLPISMHGWCMHHWKELLIAN